MDYKASGRCPECGATKIYIGYLEVWCYECSWVRVRRRKR